MNEHEEYAFDLDDLDDRAMSGLLKKAKRKNTLRTAMISAGVTLLMVVGGFFGYVQLDSYNRDRTFFDLETITAITQPNVEHLLQSPAPVNAGLLHNGLSVQTYKIIEGIPVRWETQIYEYSLWGSFQQLNRAGSITLEEGQSEINATYNPQTFQRELEFFLPFLSYKEYADDLPLLAHMEGQAAELALSFDKPYSSAEIEKMLPAGVHPQWYWVDAYYDKTALLPHEIEVNVKRPDGSVFKVPQTVRTDSPEQARSVYGFDARSGQTEESFLQAVERGLSINKMHHDEFARIYNYLRGDKVKPTPADVKILGVVVTGTAEALQQLQGASYLKASVLGVTVDVP
ncbi:sigma factor regulator [Tumebacillus sp. BK434]|uniref:anti sigma factor C-terminal domain-containing protein n=1 Tax=Tumebacillus sp. BK434 TaxID=2512169 RepID=UPI001043BC3F|nr:anti sigma factor C-terminal domain-containing protein [Tumebacillus sp. BK434]TCP52690.1 sigma factor regulator [Tumebacillus sp. BK434]